MTTYNIRIGNIGADVHLQVDLPITNENPSFVLVTDAHGADLVGLELAHGEIVAGSWPTSGGDWVDSLHVSNPTGDLVIDGPVQPVAVRLISTPQSRAVTRHPAQDDELAVARAVGVVKE